MIVEEKQGIFFEHSAEGRSDLRRRGQRTAEKE